MRELFRRLYYLLNRRRFDDELAAEMESHQELAARGGDQNFGNPLRLREEARDAWGWTWIDRLGQDLRYTMRTMRRSPGFTVAAVLMLAIGIGINTAAFGFFNVVVIKPLPVRDPETLVRFHRLAPQMYSSDVPYPAMEFYRKHTKTLSAVLALDFGRLEMEGEANPVRASFVTGNFLAELGAGTRLGRLFDAANAEDGRAEPVAVLGHDFWQRHCGADSAIAGKVIRLNGKPLTVIGVTAANFSGFTYSAPDMWLPLIQQPHFVEGSQLLTSWSSDSDGVDMWGRMIPGVSAKVVEAEMRSLAVELRRQHPDEIWEGESLSSEPGGYAQNAGGRERGNAPSPSFRAKLFPVFAMVSALAFLILAVACGNLGSLLLARGVARRREMMIRSAVGAGSGRLIRQLLTESLVLALMGSGVGLALGTVVLRSMMLWSGAPAWIDVVPDWRVITFTVGLGFATAVVFGLTPALQVVRQRHLSTTPRQFLIGAQVTASCVLLIVAGLLVRALNHAISASPGFEYKQVISIDPHLENHGYSSGAARAYLETLQGRLRSLPGVESVSLAATPPLGNRRTASEGEKDGRKFDVTINRVNPEFFQTMKIPLLRGRHLRLGETGTVIVSESLARRMWPGDDPLGQRLFDHDTVVGVAGNARALALADTDAVESYHVIAEGDLRMAAVLVRTSGPVESLAPAIVSIGRDIDPKVVPAVETLKSAFARKLESTERVAVAVSVLGLVALLLSCLGIVGVVAYAVSQRTREIGLRMALGAKPHHVLLAILRQFSGPVGAGLVLGAGGAAVLSQLLRKELYGISNLDPVAYPAAIALFLLAAALAGIVPARRALRIDPMLALRQD